MKGRGKRQGSVYLLVLVVMISSMSLVTGLQHVLTRRTRNLAYSQTQQMLHNSLLLGLQESMRLLSEDDDLTVDSIQDLWAQPVSFTTSEGVSLRLQLEDAQTRLNLNHLTLPVTPAMPRSWLEIFAELFRNAELNPDPAHFTFLQQQLDGYDIWFHNAGQITLLMPEAAGTREIMHLLTALPRPGSRPLAMNINTVHPEVLQALVGDSLQGWVDGVLAARENQPIRNLGEVLRSVPAPVRPLLLSVLDVRCVYVNAKLTAVYGESEQSLTVLLKRSGEDVEVIQCQW